MHTRLRRLGALASLAVVALLLAACDSSVPADNATPPANATVVNVSAREYSYTLDTTEIPAGPVSFVLTNDGAMGHDLVLEGGPGGATPVISPGETATLTVTLTAGTYTLYCSVGNHRAQGMEIDITVS